MQTSPHSFHIPVMGTGFTLDTPLRVARYGISSVISLVDDSIIEEARKYHAKENGLPFEPIAAGQLDARARRITAYLNLVDALVRRQVLRLKESGFEAGSEICRYFDLLPPSPLRDEYLRMRATADPRQKGRLQDGLRRRVVAGSIDVNIMTKLDMDRFRNGRQLPAEYADGMSALRGFAQSDLSSAIVFSAGINQRLYTYTARFDDFFPVAGNSPKKRIILKVGDYRSALIQGKFLAKRGLWVSEFRIESSLNCGGHAFASECHLLGPVLEQFKQNRNRLTEILYDIYAKVLTDLGRTPETQPRTRITVQGGIGTSDENSFLLEYYQLDGTGWGTPFMVVPEVTNVDTAHLEKICRARKEDIYLSQASPLGIPFWNLRTSASEEKRRAGIAAGKPGSACPKGFACLNTEFTEQPICTASHAYITQRLNQLPHEGLTEKAQALVREEVLSKSCICHDLGAAASIKLNGGRNKATPAICCGPNIRSFNRVFSLDEMVHHIYGRLSIIANLERPHMFIEEMRLNQAYLREEITRFAHRISKRPQAYFETFKKSLLEGIEYYQGLTRQFIDDKRKKFIEDLNNVKAEIEEIAVSLSGLNGYVAEQVPADPSALPGEWRA